MEALAADQQPTAVVRNRQRIADTPIAHDELTFEIATPNVVRLSRMGQRLRLRRHLMPLAPRLDQAVTFKDLADGTVGRPVEARIGAIQVRADGDRSPIRVPVLQLKDLGYYRF